jgi:hypothetical protein
MLFVLTGYYLYFDISVGLCRQMCQLNGHEKRECHAMIALTVGQKPLFRDNRDNLTSLF